MPELRHPGIDHAGREVPPVVGVVVAHKLKQLRDRDVLASEPVDAKRTGLGESGVQEASGLVLVRGLGRLANRLLPPRHVVLHVPHREHLSATVLDLVEAAVSAAGFHRVVPFPGLK